MKINSITNIYSYRNIYGETNINGKVSFRSQNETCRSYSYPDKSKQANFLSLEELHNLETNLKKGGKEKEIAKQRLMAAFQPLVYRISQYYKNAGQHVNFDIDDIIQEGNIGLHNAIDKFDIEKGTDFTEYISNGIKMQIMHSLTKNHLIKIPRKDQEPFLRVAKTYNMLLGKYSNEYMPERIAAELKIPINEVERLLKYGKKVVSLNDINEIGREIGETIPDNKESVRDVVHSNLYNEELIQEVHEELKRLLTPKQYQVLVLHQGLNGEKPKKFKQIVPLFKTSTQSLSLAERRAFEKIYKSYRLKKIFKNFIKENE